MNDITRKIFEHDRLMSLLEVEMVEGQPGHVVLRYVVKDNIVQMHGSCHGGVIFSLADAACGIAANSEDVAAVTQNCAIAYLKPARIGEVLIVTARERSKSGRTHLIDVDVQTEHGELVAEFRGFTRETR